MGPGILLILATAAGAFFSLRSPSEKELLDRFAEAQRFYAEGAYDQAIAQYGAVSRVRSRVLDAKAIAVDVGGASYPVQEAAVYQIGNANRKLFADDRRFAGSVATQEQRRQYEALADSALAHGAAAFRQVIAQATNAELRAQAYGRLIELYYEAGRYPDVIDLAAQLLAAYSASPLTKVAYYNTGWAYYETGDYARAAAAFRDLLAHFPSGYESDRALFQVGECHLAMGGYEDAIAAYRDLVARQRLDDLGPAELERMKKEKLAGLVDETALELAAKAQIRVGTCLAHLGRYDEGLQAFRTVITRFSAERSLVEEAYLQMAQLYEDRGDVDAAMATYREAVRETRDRVLRARIQFALAERLFTRGQYPEAIGEYRIYLQGHGEVAQQAGFPEARVRYRVGGAYQQWAHRELDAGDAAAGHELLRKAVIQYDSLLAGDGGGYGPDATFNRALAQQTLGGEADLAAARQTYERLIDGGDGSYAERCLVQLAQLHLTQERYAEADEAVTRLLRQYPASEQREQALLFQGLARQALGNLAAAVAAFEAIPPGSALYGRAMLACGHALVALGRHAAAAAALGAGLPVAGPDQASSFHYLLGQAHHALGDDAEAMSQFGAGLEGGPPADLAEALHLARGNTALGAGDAATAVADLGWVVDHAADPARVKFARDALAIAYLRQNRGTDALAVLDAMAGAAQTPQERAELFARILDLYYERDDYAGTIAMAERLLALEIDDGPTAEREFGLREKAAFLLGDARMRTGAVDAGIAIFESELARHPRGAFSTAIRLSLATHRFAAGDLEAAVEQFVQLRALELEPEQAFSVDFYLANARYSLRQFDPAREIFARLLQERPKAPERSDLLFGLGESNYQLGEFAAAAGYYRQILQEFPAEASADDAQYNLAWCLVELDQEDAAIAEFERLLQNYPHSEFAPAAQFTLGDYHYNRQEYREATAAYERVQQEHPTTEVAGQVPHLLGELREALAYEDYEQGLALMDSAEAAQDNALFERAVAIFEQVRRQYPGTESELGALSNMGVCLEALGRWRDAVALYDEVIALFEGRRATREAFQFAKAHRDWIVSTRL